VNIRLRGTLYAPPFAAVGIRLDTEVLHTLAYASLPWLEDAVRIKQTGLTETRSIDQSPSLALSVTAHIHIHTTINKGEHGHLREGRMRQGFALDGER
jgi:hypothetical protein